MQSIVNHDVFISFVGGDRKNATEMVDLFIVQSDKYLQSLAVGLSDNNPALWRDTAHKLKGMAAFAGTELLYACATDAQKQWEDTPDNKKKILADMRRERDRAVACFTETYCGA